MWLISQTNFNAFRITHCLETLTKCFNEELTIRPNYNQQLELQYEYRKFITDFQPTTFITLATNQQQSVGKLRLQVKSFFGQFDRQQLGHTWLKKPACMRTDGFVLIEHVDSNIHAHCGVRLAEGKMLDSEQAATKIWDRICKSGSLDFQPVTYATGVASYLTKEMRKPSFNYENQIILLGEFFSNN